MYFCCICGEEGDLRVLLFRHLLLVPSLLIFCSDYLPFDESGLLKSLSIIVLLSMFPFIVFSICLIYGGARMLNAYIFTIIISCFWVDPLIIM